MNDKKLATELEGIANWIDALYERLRGAEITLATEPGNETYCESLMGDIGRVVEIGVAMDRQMEQCGCLFQSLAEFSGPAEYLMRARVEVNNLAVAIRQRAQEAYHATAGAVAPEAVKPMGALELHCRTTAGTHADKARAWLKAHPKEKRSFAQMQRACARYKHSKPV